MSDVPSEYRYDRSLVDGPIAHAVWKIAWPTMLQNMIGGLQGIIDHTLVGHFVGFTANAAIGVSWQIVLVVIVFISSLYTGMGVLVARFVGANRPDEVNRVVLQATVATLVLGLFVLAPIGYLAAPGLLDLVHASPEVQREALPFLRTFFLGSCGMLMFFMLGGALRAAGDARTPLRLGIAMTILNIIFNVVFISGAGPIPALGTQGAALGTVCASVLVSAYGLWRIGSRQLVVQFPDEGWRGVDWAIVRSLFKFGLPTGIQGVIMNAAGVMMLRFIGALPQSAEAQAAYAVGYTELFSFITWTSVGLMGATATLAGQNLGAGKPERSVEAARVASRIGLGIAFLIGSLFVLIPRQLLAIFGMVDGEVVGLSIELLRYLAFSGFFITVALAYTGALQGTGDTRSPLAISILSQVAVPIGLCTLFASAGQLESGEIWLAIVAGHVTRCLLSVLRFRQGKWRKITVGLDPVKA